MIILYICSSCLHILSVWHIFFALLLRKDSVNTILWFFNCRPFYMPVLLAHSDHQLNGLQPQTSKMRVHVWYRLCKIFVVGYLPSRFCLSLFFSNVQTPEAYEMAWKALKVRLNSLLHFFSWANFIKHLSYVLCSFHSSYYPPLCLHCKAVCQYESIGFFMHSRSWWIWWSWSARNDISSKIC